LGLHAYRNRLQSHQTAQTPQSGLMYALPSSVTRSNHAGITTNPRRHEIKTTSSTSSSAAC
ncbi:MAG TPA: hypothetical protein VKV32_01970, partial [Stellaceae bacterium]|nr:hypothetical protein [Stellaceae bacterium]